MVFYSVNAQCTHTHTCSLWFSTSKEKDSQATMCLQTSSTTTSVYYTVYTEINNRHNRTTNTLRAKNRIGKKMNFIIELCEAILIFGLFSRFSIVHPYYMFYLSFSLSLEMKAHTVVSANHRQFDLI